MLLKVAPGLNQLISPDSCHIFYARLHKSTVFLPGDTVAECMNFKLTEKNAILLREYQWLLPADDPWPLLQERWVSNIPHPKPPSPPPHTCFTKVPLCLIIQASKYIVYHFKNTSITTKQNTVTNYHITCDILIKFKMRMCDIEKFLSWWYLRTSEWDVAPDNQTGCIVITSQVLINTLRPRQHGCHFADNLFRCIFLNEKC